MSDYKKLVRDKIPDKIRQNGGEPITKTLDEKEYKVAIGEKVAEEAHELSDAKTHIESVEERADLEETLDAYDSAHGINREEINA